MALGNTDHIVRIYTFIGGEMGKMCELDEHTHWVEFVQFSHHDFTRFISGSRDGTVRVWRYNRGIWKSTVLLLANRPDRYLAFWLFHRKIYSCCFRLFL